MSLGLHTKEKYYDRIDIAQLAVSVLVFFLSLIWMGLAGVAGFGKVTADFGATMPVEPGMVITLVLTGLVIMGIAFVSAVTTIQKITGNAKTYKPSRDKMMIWSIAELLVVFGLAALAGLASEEIKAVAWAILAVPGIAIPVIWLLRIGGRNQTRTNPKRDYGILTFTIGISAPFIFLVELLAGIILLIVVVAGLFDKPQFYELINTIRNNPMVLQEDPGEVFSGFRALFSEPGLLGWLLLGFAGIIPLVEELFKTIAVWLLKVRDLNPAESFRAGLLSGGAFALFEGLLSARSVQLSGIGFGEWAGLILGRFGGSLLHILAGGIIGLAIGKFWQNRKIGSLLLSYLAAWLLHAAWNALAVFGGVNPLINQNQAQPVWPYFGLIVLFLGMLFLFLRLIKKAQPGSNLADTPIGLEG